MGCCLSKNDPISNTNPYPQPKQVVQIELSPKKTVAVESDLKEEVSEQEEENPVSMTTTVKKKEVFVIQHRKSNEKRSGGPDSDGSVSNSTDPLSESGKQTDPNSVIGSNILAVAASGQPVRTSSCTKEEVDAILIQCGRLSRSSSGNGKRYCGSKRSYDFDRENEVNGDVKFEVSNNGDGEEDERLRRRQSRGSNRRRSTPSRSRERLEKEQQQRSGSNGRRVSRSPQRRSESPMSHNSTNSSNVKPGKLVSVPATVSSLSIEKGNSGDGGNVKRVLVKRNVGSPRSQSPARGNPNGNQQQQQQQQSLSRNGSRKAEHSPYRRTPLNEIDMNSLPFQPLANKKLPNKGKEIEEDVVVVVKQPLNSAFQVQNKYSETPSAKASGQGTHRRTGSRGAEGYELTKTNYCRVNELQIPNVELMTEPLSPGGYDAMLTPVIVSGTETLKLPQTLSRSRSARRSRDLDINVDALLNPIPVTNYNSLLLQDIQNFHQKNSSSSNSNSNSNGTNTPYTLPSSVTKACAILEAVADLNSCNRSTAETAPNRSKKRLDGKDPFVESEVKMGDDLTEPSLHKYVTVRKRGTEFEDEESSGSNSFVGGGGGGGHQNWVSSSSWEPNSVDSTDCWTSKSYTREDDFSPVGFQRHAISDLVACGVDSEGAERKYNKNGVEKFDHHQQMGATRSKIGGARGSIQTS